MGDGAYRVNPRVHNHAYQQPEHNAAANPSNRFRWDNELHSWLYKVDKIEGPFIFVVVEIRPKLYKRLETVSSCGVLLSDTDGDDKHVERFDNCWGVDSILLWEEVQEAGGVGEDVGGDFQCDNKSAGVEQSVELLGFDFEHIAKKVPFVFKGDQCWSGEQVRVVLEFGGDQDGAGQLRLE